MVGKNKMKNWKAAVGTWERNNFGETKRNNQPAVKGSKYKYTTGDGELHGGRNSVD